jgi:hypothetical protein
VPGSPGGSPKPRQLSNTAVNAPSNMNGPNGSVLLSVTRKLVRVEV